MGINAHFIESDIMEVIEKVHEKFDIVFASTGVLCWIPDISALRKLFAFFKRWWILLLHDGHPFRSVMYAEDGSTIPNQIVGNYFRKQVWQYENLGDYTDPDFLIPEKSYEWNWTMGEIVTAFCDAGYVLNFCTNTLNIFTMDIHRMM